MQYVLLSLLRTLLVLCLIGMGVWGGRRLARVERLWRWLVLSMALLLIGMIGLTIWIPRTSEWPLLTLLVAERREFLLLGLVGPVVMVYLICQLDQKRKRVLVGIFTGLFLGVYSVLPFFMPALEYSGHARRMTEIDSNGVCLQSSGYTCGPAAAVTALRRIGIPAEEGALALRGFTSTMGGTPLDMLSMAIREEYGVETRILYDAELSQLAGQEPWIALVKFAPRVDHYVTVLSVTDSRVEVGDPLLGKKLLSTEAFLEEWRNAAVVFDLQLPSVTDS